LSYFAIAKHYFRGVFHTAMNADFLLFPFQHLSDMDLSEYLYIIRIQIRETA
ncbi:MAG: hypothetical protein ACI9V9_001359, partial [Oleispira sp.]